MKRVNLNRQVFNKQKFHDTVDTSFSELGVEDKDLSFFDVNLATQEDFFTLYSKLFFEIPKEGNINSHTYLIKESTDFIGAQKRSSDIQALLDEIAELRSENLELRTEAIKKVVEENGGIFDPPADNNVGVGDNQSRSPATPNAIPS